MGAGSLALLPPEKSAFVGVLSNALRAEGDGEGLVARETLREAWWMRSSGLSKAIWISSSRRILVGSMWELSRSVVGPIYYNFCMNKQHQKHKQGASDSMRTVTSETASVGRTRTRGGRLRNHMASWFWFQGSHSIMR